MFNGMESDVAITRGHHSPRIHAFAVAALVGSLVISPLTAILSARPAVADSAGSFATSFEAADAQPLDSTAYSASVNVAGKKYGPGSLLGYVDAVSASGENAPGEPATAAADAASSTKWLVFATTGWLTYHLSTPQVVKGYRMTSANDDASRDPRTWTIEGSNDGSTWTTIDSQSNQSFSTRQTTYTYTVDNATAFSSYRLNISQNNGSSNIIQLADWELTDGSDNAAGPSPMILTVGSGPASAPTAKTSVGFTGTKALRYVGSHLAAGDAQATGTLYQGLSIPIGSKTKLSYQLFPVLETSDLSYPATYAAVDLELSDGSTTSLMSNTNGLVDQNGFGVSARDHGREKALYGSQWNYVSVDLGGLAGKTITKILFTYDNPDGVASTSFSGWLDDISIADATAIDPSSLANFVDTRRGTNANSSFSRGNNIPATAVPNGFNFFTPMTDAGSDTWLYSYQQNNNSSNKPTLQAIGISHEPSPWMGDREQLAVMPTLDTGQPNGSLSNRALAFTHDHEVARPDLYSVTFDNGLKAEVTPSDHAGVYRFTFPDANGGSVLVDKTTSGQSSGLSISSDGVVTGWTEGGSGLSVGNSRMFVYGQFSQAPSAVGMSSSRTSAAYARFAASSVELRIATSFISSDQAKHNLDLEVAGKSFDQVRGAATDAWNARLGAIEVPNASQAQKVTLYSNLYRLNLYPNSQSENTGSADSPAWKYASPVNAKSGNASATATNAQINDGKIYVNNGFWDTYRTVWPLYAFLYPDFAKELVDGFVEQYRAGGWIARWSSPGYANLMTGTSSDASFAEAYVAGAIPTSLALQAYDAALKNATVLPTSDSVGRKGLDTSPFLGYTSTATGESVSWGLEGYINDYAIGRMAAKLADDPATPTDRVAELKDESAYLLNRADDAVNSFDSSVGFFQGRNASGSFAKSKSSYDPTAWGGDYTETDGWNFAFHMPYDVDGLAALYGGQKGLIEKLDDFFNTPETGSYGIHEAKEARDVRMGQFGMSNQVSHHIPYIAAAAGQPSLTQQTVREVLQRLFVGSEDGQGYPGDEDNGEMSSWYIFSALGFYPLSLGSGSYVIGSPLYDKAIVHHGDSTLTILADGNTKATPYVADVKLDGTEHDSTLLSQTALKGNRTLSFTMSGSASQWGSTADASSVRTPLVDATSDEGSALSASDTAVVAALADDNSRTWVTLDAEKAELDWTSTNGPVQVSEYTITNGASGTAPAEWQLEGSNDGSSWTTLDHRADQSFAWATQTRPFSVAEPGLYQRYRLKIAGTASGQPATLAEIELLADPTSQGDLAIHPQTAKATTGEQFGGAYAVVRGGGSDLSDYQASVDFLDGKGSQAATVTAAKLGGVQVSLPHVFAAAGSYSVVVTVAVKTDAGVVNLATNSLVAVATSRSAGGAFDAACLTKPGTGVDCDGNGYGLSKTALADTGFVQGSRVTVPGTDLSFALGQIDDGKPDNATGSGQVLDLNVGAGATKIAFIGFANEGQKSGTATITYADKSTQDVTISFGDWVGAATSPISGNSVVATVSGRLQGTSGSDNKTTSIFATTPVDLNTGSTPVSVTMPNLNHTLKEGQLHVFAVADNGTPTTATPLSLTAGHVDDQEIGKEFSSELATAAGGDGVKTATIYWGDQTATTEATVNGGKVSGTHTYVVAGDYTAVVTVDDGSTSTAVEVPITVTPAYDTALHLAHSTVDSGSEIAITGTGFRSGEAVAVNLSTNPVVSKDVTAGSDGSISVSLTVPKRTPTGSYVVTAMGARSQTPATADLTVRTVRESTTVTLTAPATAKYGEPVTLTAKVSGDAVGAVQFLDGNTPLGLSSLDSGKATLVVVSLGAGTHSLRATYAGDSWHAPSSSAVARISISRSTVTLSVPTLSAKKVVWGSASAILSVRVGGLAAGSISFVSGSRTLAVGQVAKTSDGTVARAALSPTAPVGTYRNIKAVWAGDANHSPAVSAAARSSLTITKAKPKAIRVVPTTFTKHTRPRVLVVVSQLTNGQWPAGTVKLHVSGGKTVSARLSSAMSGLVWVRLGTSKKSVKVWAEFRPTDTKHVSSVTSKKVTIKAR